MRIFFCFFVFTIGIKLDKCYAQSSLPALSGDTKIVNYLNDITHGKEFFLKEAAIQHQY